MIRQCHTEVDKFKMVHSLLLLGFVPCLVQGFILDSFRNQADWNGLKVTWSLNPFSAFNSLPRTKHAAESGGWVDMAPGDSCDSNSKFRGKRYWKNHDLGVILIYDSNGYIAGIQIGVPSNYSPNPNHFPYPNQRGAPFVLDGNNYYLTAYFVDPSTICTGRTAVTYNGKTGTGLWIQNGTDPIRDALVIPMNQAEADKSKWTKGACFVSMGVHYWYNLRTDMDCRDFYPVFLLYNKGVLNAFGWALSLDVETSSRLEHPPKNSYSMFMTETPTCLASLGTLTTLHIYMTDSALADQC